MDHRIFHLSLPVSDLAAAKAFYCDVLGATPGRDGGQWADIVFFGHQLTLHHRPGEVLSPEQQGARHFGAILAWQEWTALGARLEASGCALQLAPTVFSPGTAQEHGKLQLCDPSGNLIEIKAYRNVAVPGGGSNTGLQPAASAPADFDFVLGDWLVRHRRLKERMVGCQEWVEFEGEMSTRRILGGFGNIEDNLLRFPEGEFRAAALRSFDAATGKWSIWWLDGRFPGKVDIPVTGAFTNGVGTFFAEDSLDGKPILIRFIWSRSTDQALRWEQAFSGDNGQTWETNWTMDFTPRPHKSPSAPTTFAEH